MKKKLKISHSYKNHKKNQNILKNYTMYIVNRK